MSSAAQATAEQQTRASDPATSAWVSANAGSGKTHVLVNRVIRLMLASTAPERILCLTYTRAAAAEMSRRLFDELAGWIAMNDQELLNRIHEHTGHVSYRQDELAAARQLFARALETPGGLKVQTIHAFCERLLQRFPVEAGMVPGFEVMDELAQRELLSQASARVLAVARSQEDAAVTSDLANIVGLTSADRFDGLLKELLDNRHVLMPLLHHEGALQAQLDELRQALGLQNVDSQTELISRTMSALDVATYQRAMSATVIKKPIRECIETLLHAQTDQQKLLAWQSVFLTAKGDERAPGGMFTTKAEADEPDLHRFMLDEQQRVLRISDQIRAARVLEATGALLRVGLEIVKAYEAEKRKRGLSDYDDLISKTRELLEEKDASLWVLYKLDGGLDHILIDEAQDTSPQQWSIVARLAEEFFAGEGASQQTKRTVFAVGDYKQSIYSFQGADPAEFARMQAHFRDQSSGIGAQLEEVPLLTSFRSTPEVLGVVDKVFAQPLADIGLADMIESGLTHTPRRTGQAGRVELWPLETSDEQPGEDMWRAPRRIDAGSHPRLRLAHKIASTIRHWVETREELTPRGRPIRYSDILILVRQRTTFMDALVRALKLAGIPVAGADRLRLTGHIAVQDLLALARFVLLPEDDLTLASVLKSPLVARDDGEPIDEDDLFALAYGRGKLTLWQRLASAVSEGAAYSKALRSLEAWRARSGFATPYQFFSEVLIADGRRKALLQRLGTEAADPIDAFLSEALNFQAGHTPSLHEFLGWLEGADVQIKRDMDHGANEVRIMTVHGAKGLEANVVILPDTTSVPDKKKVPEILFAESAGLGPLPVWKLRADLQPSLTKDLTANYLGAQMAEYNRLLYVAMTRARDRLYVCGYSNKDEARPDSWYGLVASVLAQPEYLTADGSWRIDGQQSDAIEDRREDSELAVAAEPAPGWATVPPPAEPASLRWFVPSRLGRAAGDETVAGDERVDPPLGGAGEDRFRRGNLIHKLLQILPELPASERATAGARYLDMQRIDDGNQILAEVMALTNDPAFAPVFAPGSRAEVPLAAQVDLGSGPIGLTGQIDRLVVRGDEVLIIDYKTNRPAPQRIEAADSAYIRQMAAYRAALRTVYPDKTVRAALLWTNSAKLMEVPQGLMDEAL